MKLRTVIVDDEPLARSLLRELLSQDPEVRIVAECGNGRDAVQAVNSSRPDLVFLDIQMPEMSGLEVLAALEGAAAPYVIFVTAYDRYAIEAFQMHALDYLLKPFSKERFRQSLERAKESIHRRELAGLAEKMSSLATSYADLKASFAAHEGSATIQATELRIPHGPEADRPRRLGDRLDRGGEPICTPPHPRRQPPSVPVTHQLAAGARSDALLPNSPLDDGQHGVHRGDSSREERCPLGPDGRRQASAAEPRSAVGPRGAAQAPLADH